jgi:hypothetical protein
MRALLATLAFAGAIVAGCAQARAQITADERTSVAMMSASDVVRALRCAPPFGCERQHFKRNARTRRTASWHSVQRRKAGRAGAWH